MYENYTTLPLLCYSSRDHRPPAHVDIGKLSNFVSTINWPKTFSKGLAKAKLISLTTEERHLKRRTAMRMECLSTGEVYSYYKLYEEASSPL